MSEPFVFDPRCELCKLPYGAVPAGAGITLHVRPLSRENFDHCSLICLFEFSGSRRETELIREGTDGDRVRFSLSFAAPDYPELVWYYFRFWRNDGSGCFLDQTGYRSEGEPACWQLTVYSDAQETPRWFGEGITYQIFPDRFCRLSTPDPSHMVGNRWVHADWSDPPQWQPDPDGEIRCRDFFGGSLKGICSKLDYLKSLSVSTLYLCPIFESASNHRYNTADYMTVDPMLGGDSALAELAAAARGYGIRLMLDGVFSHTGSESVYFKEAQSNPHSPCRDWYDFTEYPDKYRCWWGFETLPEVKELTPSYMEFIGDVMEKYAKMGITSWRLDVADELPDGFIEFLRKRLKSIDPDGVLLGEVWEEATNKHSMGGRRKYVDGHELDSVMDYPFRRLLMDFFLGRTDGERLATGLLLLMENYPPQFYESLLNLMGSHDVVRAITALAGAPDRDSLTREQQAAYSPTIEQLKAGRKRFMAAAAVQYMMPGAPCLYYGDEAGLTGMADPFNRGTYPWGQEDTELIAYFQKLGELHKRAKGGCAFAGRGDVFALYRPEVICMVNRSCEPVTACFADKDFCGNIRAELENGCIERELPPYGAAILIKGQEERA